MCICDNLRAPIAPCVCVCLELEIIRTHTNTTLPSVNNGLFCPWARARSTINQFASGDVRSPLTHGVRHL